MILVVMLISVMSFAAQKNNSFAEQGSALQGVDVNSPAPSDLINCEHRPITSNEPNERNIILSDSCIEQGQACVLNGTPCCGSYTCQGRFPNTTCQ
jgi:hypothetical protein